MAPDEPGVLALQGTRLLQLVLDFLFDRGDFAPGGAIGPKKILGLQGGTRSGKTFAVNQGLLIASHDPDAQARRWEFETVRKALATLRATAMKDFFTDVLKPTGLYSEKLHQKTENRYRIGACELGWLGADQAQKLRGNSRNVLYANEANELEAEDWRQLRYRTSDKIILDWNPDERVEWIDDAMKRADAHLDISTYLDNPYAPQGQIDEVEETAPRYLMPSGETVVDWDLQYDPALPEWAGAELVDGDAESWRVWGLGQRGTHKAAIYPEIVLVDEIPEHLTDRSYGLDFGFTNPSALVECAVEDVVGRRPRLYWDELIYERQLTDDALATLMRDAIAPEHRRRPIFCDHEGDRILALQQAGFPNAEPANKEVKQGIVTVRRYTLCITKRSANLLKEARAYRRKIDPRSGEVTEEVVKHFDHAVDAARYGTHSYWGPRERASTPVIATTERRPEGVVPALNADGTLQAPNQMRRVGMVTGTPPARTPPRHGPAGRR